MLANICNKYNKGFFYATVLHLTEYSHAMWKMPGLDEKNDCFSQ